jgi:hypothetical protein
MNNSVRSLYFIRVRTIRPLDISKHYEFFHSLKPRSSRLIRMSSPHLRLGLQSGLFRQSRSATDYKIINFKILQQHSSGETDETHKKSLTNVSRRRKNWIPSKCELEASTLFPPVPWKQLPLLPRPVQNSVHFKITVFRHVILRTLLLLQILPSEWGNMFFETSVHFYQNISRHLSESCCLHCHGTETHCCSFLGVFARLRKATISFVVSFHPSLRTEQLGSHWTDFHEIWYLNIFEKSVQKIEVLLKSDKNDWHFTWTPTHIYDHTSFGSS